MKGILEYIKPYRAFMLLTLFLKFVAAMMDLLIPSLLARIIDDIVPTGQVRLIFLWGGVMLICTVFSVTTPGISADEIYGQQESAYEAFLNQAMGGKERK